MKWKSSALFDFFADFFAEDAVHAGTIKGYFVLAVAVLPLGFQTHRVTSSEYARICPC